jgi:VID27 C-terminal WD40-like domain
MMLHNQDASMVLQNPDAPNSLFNLDIETGKVVEEWKVHDDVPVEHMAPNTKFSQAQPDRTLVGASHNALFRVDPRLSGNKMVDSQYKQYASKNKFSSVATTASGKLAVGSEKGDIRLFDVLGKNAKTALPPLGDPILGVDVTANGRYIIATTKTYLLLIDTLIGEGRYKGQLGFERSFPADAKPMPKRLQLRPEHVMYMGGNVSFTTAR